MTGRTIPLPGSRPDLLRLAFTGCVLVAAACGGGATTSTDSAPTSGQARATGPPAPTIGGVGTTVSTEPAVVSRIVDIDEDAVAVNVVAADDGVAAVAWTTPDAVYVSMLDIGTGAVGVPIDISGDLVPVAHPIERPAIASVPDGSVLVAFTTPGDGGGSVATTFLTGADTSDPTIISGDPTPETNLVHATVVDGSPVLAWLEDSSLSVAIAEPSVGLREHEAVDDLTCDCCNPVPIGLADGTLAVTYRDRDTVDDRVVRNAAIVTIEDGSTSFGEPLVVADDHWFLDACPFSGPSVVEAGATLVVAWMDGRQSVHPDQDGTTIWVDRSEDGGRSFGTDLAVTDGGIHRWPVMASVGTVVHLIWEVQAGDGGIARAVSSDEGRSFGPTALIVENADRRGLARSPSVALVGDALVVTWVDGDGAHALVLPA